MPTPTLLAQRLNLWQTFRETVWGTAGAATARWMGVMPYPTVTPFRKTVVHDEARGSLAPGFVFNQMQRGGTWKVSGKVSYQDVIFLGHSFWAQVSPTGSNPYTYTYAGATTAQPNLTTFTVEYGQANALSRATGCVANKLSLGFEAGKEWTYDLSGFAQDIDSAWAGPAASLADRSIVVALGAETALFMDASGAAIGTTAFAGRLISAKFEGENGATPVSTAGQLTPPAWVIGDKWKTSLTLRLLVASDVRTFVNSTLQSPAGALVRLRSTQGAAIMTLDMAGVLTDDIEQLGEFQGAALVEVKLAGYYDSGAALHTNLTAVNAVSTIP